MKNRELYKCKELRPKKLETLCQFSKKANSVCLGLRLRLRLLAQMHIMKLRQADK